MRTAHIAAVSVASAVVALLSMSGSASAQQATAAAPPGSSLMMAAWLAGHGPITMSRGLETPTECAAAGKDFLAVATDMEAGAAAYGCTSADGTPTLRRACVAFADTDAASASGATEIERAVGRRSPDGAWWACTTRDTPDTIREHEAALAARIRTLLENPVPAR